MNRKNIVCLAVTLLISSAIILTAATPTMEVQYTPEYGLLRAEADEDSSTLDLTTEGDFANMPAGAKNLMGEGVIGDRKIDIITCAGAAANKTYTVTFYGYKHFNGPAQRIMSVDYTTGTQAVVKYPNTAAAATNKFWADTAVVTSYRSVLVGKNDCDGNNGVAELTIYCPFKYLYAEVTGADGETGAEAGDVSIYYSKRN